MDSKIAQKRKTIAGVDRYRVVEPLFEGCRVILSYRGETYSPAYIQGISGAAFRIAGICPCAPTCSYMMEPQDLLGLLGYEAEPLAVYGEGPDPDVHLDEVLARVKDEIRADRPVLFWNAFTNCEWDVVCGFDDEEKQIVGRGSYVGLDEYAVADETRTLTAGARPLIGAILIGEKSGAFDAREAEAAALKEAVRHARSKSNEDKLCGDQWVMLEGLLCYDRWVGDFEADPPKVSNLGDFYCLSVYRSTHRAAADFAREIVPKYPAAREHLEYAAEQFAAEADQLHKCFEAVFPDGRLTEEADLARNSRAADVLSRARECYPAGPMRSSTRCSRSVRGNSQRSIRSIVRGHGCQRRARMSIVSC
jgi:hypothetical protein